VWDKKTFQSTEGSSPKATERPDSYRDASSAKPTEPFFGELGEANLLHFTNLLPLPVYSELFLLINLGT
jgi:hypothetical protein